MFRFVRNFILSAVLLSAMISCSDADEKPCDKVFLDKIGSRFVYYTGSQLISEFSFAAETRFSYTEAGKVSEITTFSNTNEPINKVKFYYDETGRIDYMLRFYTGIPLDSIHPTYDAQQRITKLLYYIDDELDQTIDYEYAGKNTTQSRLYTADGSYEILTLLEYDNNPRLYPAEAWNVSFLYTPLYFSENNVTKYTGTVPGSEDETVIVHAFKYNSDGLVIEDQVGETITTFDYACDQRLKE